jgi:mono/diheme cytochrome c family protein
MNKLKFLLGFAVVTLLVCLGFKWPAKVETYNLANGKIVFQDKCSGCHGAKGEGSFGPNLTDNYYHARTSSAQCNSYYKTWS